MRYILLQISFKLHSQKKNSDTKSRFYCAFYTHCNLHADRDWSFLNNEKSKQLLRILICNSIFTAEFCLILPINRVFYLFFFWCCEEYFFVQSLIIFAKKRQSLQKKYLRANLTANAKQLNLISLWLADEHDLSLARISCVWKNLSYQNQMRVNERMNEKMSCLMWM